ncbi:helix-turn-helix transcriptional regulator [Maricaulis salignorans]|uniref:helix-turn-helix transcriptional regulator n=1 Tax=Maricaulis salignorans TaxID=144026 RepID=UPI003A8F3B42
MTHPTPRYLNTYQAADFLTVSPSYLNKLRLTGDGPTYVKIGARCAYDVADLQSWVEARKRTSTSATA